MTAYLIAMMDVNDGAAYEEYRDKVPAFIAKHGGRFIVRGGAADVVEGSWPPGRIVVLEFPDYAAAQAFVADPDYQPVAEIRHRTATSHLWLVDGVPDGRTADGIHGFILGRVRIDDPQSYKTYADQVPDVVSELGGAYLARGGTCEAIEGGMDLDRMVIVGFSDVAAAKKFHSSEAYAPLLTIRTNASESNIVIVEGL
jgi:uncharacterized protein (DUF1330 family)